MRLFKEVRSSMFGDGKTQLQIVEYLRIMVRMHLKIILRHYSLKGPLFKKENNVKPKPICSIHAVLQQHPTVVLRYN